MLNFLDNIYVFNNDKMYYYIYRGMQYPQSKDEWIKEKTNKGMDKEEAKAIVENMINIGILKEA